MTQIDVYAYLKKKGDWATSKEISEKTKLARSTVLHSLRKLTKYGLIESKWTGKINQKVWKAKKD